MTSLSFIDTTSQTSIQVIEVKTARIINHVFKHLINLISVYTLQNAMKPKHAFKIAEL